MSKSAKIAKQLSAVEKKLHEGERLRREISKARAWGFIFFLLGLIMIFFSPGYVSVLSILGIILLVGSTWRINRSQKGWREVEEGVGAYRGRRAELQASLVAAKMDEMKIEK
ncbi:MAG: hypothetical protein DWQ04_10690 [Chloroflexi bacterium]|nr:MAG: hypothetical protein DWQ04_10690 [Chloroflexota bacterium]